MKKLTPEFFRQKFGSVSAAAKALGYTRTQIYNLCQFGLTEQSKAKIRYHGYCPKTLDWLGKP